MDWNHYHMVKGLLLICSGGQNCIELGCDAPLNIDQSFYEHPVVVSKTLTTQNQKFVKYYLKRECTFYHEILTRTNMSFRNPPTVALVDTLNKEYQEIVTRLYEVIDERATPKVIDLKAAARQAKNFLVSYFICSGLDEKIRLVYLN